MTAVVELTLSIRVRADERNAAEIAARLLESVEDTLGVPVRRHFARRHRLSRLDCPEWTVAPTGGLTARPLG
ncbi:hypothetical protein [Amycolatopsis albispora]|uniref:Uncharacterized protein n=1 Tax=Amycolatopsis albispora TaxID=1804986 RepID=A0A344L193_9PSEU|nr:hypothetical protein [Amycolatopsis albispora]AXB41817.1 hypothetical protein A4R43_04145 [Amycolatopsis albispora]